MLIRDKFCSCSLVNKVQLVPGSEIVGSALACVQTITKLWLVRRATVPLFPDHALIFSRALHLRVIRLKRGRCKIKFPPERITIKTLLLQYRLEVYRSWVKNGSSKFVGLWKFWRDLVMLKRFLGLQVLFSGEFPSRTLIIFPTPLGCPITFLTPYVHAVT